MFLSLSSSLHFPPLHTHPHSHRHRMITRCTGTAQACPFSPLLNRILNLCCLLFPHTCRFLCYLSLETPEQEVTKFELSRCYSSLLVFVSVHFLYVPCNLLCHIDVIQQQKKAECIPCIDYTTISRITITPIYGWKSYYLVVWWPYRFWYDYPWYDFHTIFGMPSVNSEFIPILVWNSYRCFCCV